MIILYVAFAVVFLRALIGWEIKVSKTDSLTKGQARVLALACLPILSIAGKERLITPAIILYLVVFIVGACALAFVNTKRRGSNG